MYYGIENEQIVMYGDDQYFDKENVFSVMTTSEWIKSPDNHKIRLNLQKPENIRFCKLERYSGHLLGTFHIPSKKYGQSSNVFQLFIFDNKIIFIDDSNFVLKHINKLISLKNRKSYTLELFFYDFLVLLLEGETVYLENLEKRISKLEERVLKREVKNFNFHMLEIKKEISKIYRYYSQLSDMCDTLIENEEDFFGKDDVVTFPVFSSRAQRLRSEAQAMRDYAMQVQEVYQSEISIRQNDVMKVLTIVTTIFLPLSLIAAWYGMNFTKMPELTWKYGYLFVIILSVAVLGLCIWIFKKKKMF